MWQRIDIFAGLTAGHTKHLVLVIFLGSCQWVVVVHGGQDGVLVGIQVDGDGRLSLGGFDVIARNLFFDVLAAGGWLVGLIKFDVGDGCAE